MTPPSSDPQPHLWWQHGVIYQIYPRSFQDSNGDGVGDLEGILRRLDYVQELGVHAIWLSPIFPSPMADFGYDVTDYTGIDPLFGTLEDFDRLVAEVHRRDLKILLDFVPNHTSDQHPWFIESRSSRTSRKRDWYIWRDPAPDGGPPNNWRSNFGGSAWEFDRATGQYYYHAFLKEQPDLNWRNQEVLEAMLDVLRFWLERGVDGFRVDVIWHIVKDEEFRDNPPNPDYQPGMPPHDELLATYSTDRPEVHGIIAEIRQLLDSYDERVMVGEIYLPIERLVTYYGAGGSGGAHLPFNFHLLLTPWHERAIEEVVESYEAALPPGGWPNWVLGNHDRSRLATRIGVEQARVAAVLLLTLRGTPTLYYGDEIGMHDVPIPPEAVQDPFEKNVPGLGLGRDPQRTPMQWTSGANAGFTTGRPWLPIAHDYRRINVEAQHDDPKSLLTLYRRLIALHRAEPALAVGSYVAVEHEGRDLFAYQRRHGNRAFLVALNFGSEPRTLVLPSDHPSGTLILSSHLDRDGEAIGTTLNLRADEAIVVRLV